MNVEIKVDGKKIPLNQFVKKVTMEINSGLINSLRNVPDWTAAEIKIKK